MLPELNDLQLTRYSRHLLMKGFDEAEQLALCSARVLLVGAGGLGGVAALYLAGCGVGQLVVNDHDQVDLSNLHRQIIYDEAVLGMAKTEAAKQRLQALNPEVIVTTIPYRMDQDALRAQVCMADLVMDASDNFDTRYAINRLCQQTATPLVFGAATGTQGQVTVFDPARPSGGCLQCLFDPEQDEAQADCRSAGVFSPLTGMVGTMMAGEAIKVLSAYGEPLSAHLLVINALDMRMHRIRRVKEDACPVCA